MTNITPCLSASYFNKTEIQIVDQLDGDELFCNLLILSDVAADGQVSNYDPDPTVNPSTVFKTGVLNCYIKEYTSLTQVQGDFRITSPTYAAAKAAFGAANTRLNTERPQKILIADFPLHLNSIANVPGMMAAIQRINDNWSNIVLANRSYFDQQIGLTAADTYTSFQNALAEWTEGQRENECNKKTFWGVTDDHRALFVNPYTSNLGENFIYDSFIAQYEYTIAIYHNTFSDPTTLTDRNFAWANWDLDLVNDISGNTIVLNTDGTPSVDATTFDIDGNPAYFEFPEISLVASHYTVNLNDSGSSFTYKFREIPNTTCSVPQISQTNGARPGLFLGGWETTTFSGATDASTTLETGVATGEDVFGRSFLNILTGYQPRSQSDGVSFGYLGDASITNEGGQFGRYGNVYLCVCDRCNFIEGTTSSGRFIDEIHGKDWVSVQIQQAVCDLQFDTRKIPLNSFGILLIRSAVESTFNSLQDAGIIDEDFVDNDGVLQRGYRIFTPSPGDITTANRNNRSLPCLSFEYRQAGAVHATCTTGIITR